ncbi:MAG: glycosyl hydrolase family 8 [Cytophagaceae bacterium]|nr:glycosyl hydrolase family 8 [Cytophagaceae bacterium]MDW8457007.1 glycosyl hydrolase family 8 [Cytophagaceae bacterium]
MKKITISLVLIFLSGFFFAQVNTPSGASHPFGSRIVNDPTPYDYGMLPTNLPTGPYNPSANQFGKSQDAYNAYVTWKANYAENCGGGQWRIKFDDPARTVSEGIAYGMLLAAYAADKPLFDGLWAYYKAKSVSGRGLMGWNVNGCGAVLDGGAATDADLDAAMALIVAECQWPTINTPYNYATEATNLITAIRDWEIHPTSYQAINGDGWGFGNNCRNPSYQSPAYYREFAIHVPSQAAFWNNAVTASYALLNANRHTTTGLVSNWSDPNGVPNSCNGPFNYGYDACRNPWRMATDYLWYGTTMAQTNFCTPIAAYTQGVGAANCGGPVNQNGTNAAGFEHGATFVSTYACAVMAASSTYQTHLNNMYTETVAVVDALPRYFGNTLRVLSLFMLTGNFWKPCPPSTPPSINVNITNPTNGAVFYEGDNINITANATTTNGTITNVEFYANASLLGSDATSPYSFAWNNVAPGEYALQATAYNSASESGNSSPVNIEVRKAIYRTNTPPTIDANADAIWSSYSFAPITKLIGGTVTNSSDLSGQWKAMWDNTYLYFLVVVTDDVKINNGGSDSYNDDGIEIYIDIGNDNANTYGANDHQYVFRWNDPVVTEPHGHSTAGIQFAKTDNPTGYIMEIRMPWSTLGLASPSPGTLVGLDVHINDDDDNGARDGKLSWSASADMAWTDPSYMGTIILRDLPLPVSFLYLHASYTRHGNALIQWQVYNQVNVAHYTIERADDELHFDSIHTVTAYSSDGHGVAYSYTDYTVPAGKVFYRIKQTDKNGYYSYSDVVSLIHSSGNSSYISTYPNPFSDGFYIQSTEPFRFHIYNLTGDVIYSGTCREDTFVSPHSMMPGCYILKIYSSHTVHTLPLIKQ